MKVSYRATPKLTIHAEGETVQDVFQQLASAQEVFEDDLCGMCNSENLRFVYRVVDDNGFHELQCTDCKAKLTFGTSKADKRLYARRYEIDSKGKAVRDGNGKAKKLPNGGWSRYSPTDKEE